MTRGQEKALGQRIPNQKQKYSLSSPDSYEISFFKKEIFLDYDQWQNIAEDRRPWYEYNHSSGERKNAVSIQNMIIPCLQEIIASGLTARQKEIVMMYYLYDYTQVYIANKLGISQPTVNQHLNGKKRNGKKIGGSIRRIRKIIHRMSSAGSTHRGDSHIINALDQLLDEKNSLRNSHKLIRSMLK